MRGLAKPLGVAGGAVRGLNCEGGWSSRLAWGTGRIEKMRNGRASVVRRAGDAATDPQLLIILLGEVDLDGHSNAVPSGLQATTFADSYPLASRW